MSERDDGVPTMAELLAEPRRLATERRVYGDEREQQRAKQWMREHGPFRWLRRIRRDDGYVSYVLLPLGVIPDESAIKSGGYIKISEQAAKAYK